MLPFKIQKVISKLTLKTNKNLFVAVSFLNGAFILLIVISLIYLFNQRNSLDSYGKLINHELVNLSNYRNISDNLVKTTNFDESFYSAANNDNINIISNQIIASRDNVFEIKTNADIVDIHFVENFEALITDYENLQKENELLITYLVEIGNEESGMYSKLLNTVDDFKTKYKAVENQINASNNYEQVLSSIKMLKSTRDEVIIFNTQSSINQMLEHMAKFSPDSGNYMIYRVVDALQNVNLSFQEFARKMLEIGSYPNKGLMNKLYLRYNRMELRLNESLEIVYTEKANRNIKAIIVLIFFILTIPAINLFSFYFFIKREKAYRQLFEKYIDYLNNGVQFDINDDEVLPDIYILVGKFKLFSTKFIQTEKYLGKLAKGNLSAEISKENQFEMFHSSFVEIKAKIEKLNEQIANEKSTQSQMVWIKNGIDKLTEVMRRDYDNPLLHANEIISMLVDYLKIPIGAIYLITEEDGVKYVEMASAFAYGREKQYYKKIIVGEGIVGAAASECKTLNVTSIPENYFNVISGFGETKPKNIIASPIKLNKEIYGVIELASLSRFKDTEVNFIEEVCKTIAYSFAISKVYLDTMSQYEQANLQIAELEAENESLRSDYEDVSHTYKSLAAISADNDFIVSRLSDISIRLTLDIDGNIVEVNSRFEQLFRADRRKFIQTNYRDYMADATYNEPVDFEFFWKDIRAGIQQEIETGMQIANQVYWLKQYFFPVKDDLGRVKKIQVIAFDITDKVKLQNELDELKKE